MTPESTILFTIGYFYEVGVIWLRCVGFKIDYYVTRYWNYFDEFRTIHEKRFPKFSRIFFSHQIVFWRKNNNELASKTCKTCYDWSKNLWKFRIRFFWKHVVTQSWWCSFIVMKPNTFFFCIDGFPYWLRAGLRS